MLNIKYDNTPFFSMIQTHKNE